MIAGFYATNGAFNPYYQTFSPPQQGGTLMSISTAIDASAVARALGIQTQFKDLRQGRIALLPQRVAIIGQGNTASTYTTARNDNLQTAAEVGQAYGFGSPLHLAALQLRPVNGDGIGTIPMTIFPLQDDASGVAATGTITPSGTVTEQASYIVYVNNMPSQAFVVPVGATVAAMCTAITNAINATLDLPVTATDNTTSVGLTAKWEGTSSNDILVSVVGSTTSGAAFAIGAMSGGLVNPDVDAALALVGEVWETMILNCLEIADTTTLGKYQVFGDGRWGPLTRKPCLVFTGNTEADVGNATTVSDARKTDKINCQLVAPGSAHLPFVVAARQLARIVKRANENPAYDYGSLDASGLTPGVTGDQWDFPTRDAALKAGSSTSEVKDGVINIGDVVTFYHPDGDLYPAYRHVVDVVKLMNIIFNLVLVFETDAWDGAPLIPDGQPTTNRDAKTPAAAKAAASAMLDSLGLEAIISDAETAKQNVVAQINSQNPKRLDLNITVQLSGNVNQTAIDLNFGFFFGGVATAL